MAGRQSQRDKQRSAFDYVVGHLYFYGQKHWPGGKSYKCRGIAKPFTLAAIQKIIQFQLCNEKSDSYLLVNTISTLGL
jgi:hypothetical protein